MADRRSALEADWLAMCRRGAEGLRTVLATSTTTDERARETGERGSGGDRTLVIDRQAEQVLLDELDRVRASGFGFRVLSEEIGELDYGDSAVAVIVDPIDGSLNAKRGISHHALSIAVASGPTMADVDFAYVYDFGPGEEWWARRDEGAYLDGMRLEPGLRERRAADGRLEVIGIESADPRWVAASIDSLGDAARRLRALGTIAVSLCQVAAARFDGMVSLRRCRGVDAAAGQLIVREAGGLIAFPWCSEPLAAPLTAAPESPVVAARSAEALAMLAKVPT